MPITQNKAPTPPKERAANTPAPSPVQAVEDKPKKRSRRKDLPNITAEELIKAVAEGKASGHKEVMPVAFLCERLAWPTDGPAVQTLRARYNMYRTGSERKGIEPVGEDLMPPLDRAPRQGGTKRVNVDKLRELLRNAS